MSKLQGPKENRVGIATKFQAPLRFQLASQGEPRDIIAGPDGNLWFTEYGAGQLARITPEGVVTQVQAVRGGPWGLENRRQGKIWVTEVDSSRVGKFAITP